MDECWRTASETGRGFGNSFFRLSGAPARRRGGGGGGRGRASCSVPGISVSAPPAPSGERDTHLPRSFLVSSICGRWPRTVRAFTADGAPAATAMPDGLPCQLVSGGADRLAECPRAAFRRRSGIRSYVFLLLVAHAAQVKPVRNVSSRKPRILQSLPLAEYVPGNPARSGQRYLEQCRRRLRSVVRCLCFIDPQPADAPFAESTMDDGKGVYHFTSPGGLEPSGAVTCGTVTRRPVVRARGNAASRKGARGYVRSGDRRGGGGAGVPAPRTVRCRGGDQVRGGCAASWPGSRTAPWAAEVVSAA